MSDDPDPADAPPRPLLGPAFWTMIGLSILFVLAGVGMVLIGPQLWPASPAPR